MPPPKPENRKRKYHKRSRNGCDTCKAKHIRCDELKPLCTNCLVKGGSCGYSDAKPTELWPAAHRLSTDNKLVKVEDEEHSWSWPGMPVQDATPNHLFIGYPVEMSHDSRYLFDVFVHYRSLAGQPRESFVVRRALSNPAALHSALLLSSVSYTWNQGSAGRIQKSFLHHKLEAIKFVNHQLQDPATQTESSTLSTIASLSLAESGLGSRATATAHLCGLTRIIQMRDHGKPPQRNILQNYILLVGSSRISVRELRERIGNVDIGESLCLSSFNIMLEQTQKHPQSGGINKNGRSMKSHKSYTPEYDDDNNDEIKINHYSPYQDPDDDDREDRPVSDLLLSTALERTFRSFPSHASPPPSSPPQPPLPPPPQTEKKPSPIESRARWITCFFVLYATFGTSDTDPFILSWFIEGVLDDISRTEGRMVSGEFPREFWLWGAFLGACGVRVAMTTTTQRRKMRGGEREEDEEEEDEQRREIEGWKKVCDDKLRLVSQVMGLRSWGDVRGALAQWDWDGVVGEREGDGDWEFREVWEEAVFGFGGGSGATPRSSSTITSKEGYHGFRLPSRAGRGDQMKGILVKEEYDEYPAFSPTELPILPPAPWDVPWARENMLKGIAGPQGMHMFFKMMELKRGKGEWED